MALSSIALIGAAAALAAVIFKNKESRTKEVIDFAKFSKEDVDASPQLKIIQNDINTYLTGVKDTQFHEILLDIMAKYHKPIGYFSKLNDKLILNHPYYISIKKEKMGYRYMREIRDSISSFLHFFVFVILIFMSMKYESNPSVWVQSTALVLAATSGVVLYYWLANIESKQRLFFNKKIFSEYDKLFKHYSNVKKQEVFKTHKST
ncbi:MULTISPECIES: hypothetical protein [unclassified Brenneria]|uniref:hypothetical protein n=1 Tax=unclassified Brenneria TaxID=2634434 RepID=UPI0018F0EADD|nr:hypothetical protein [Brenneria sp. L3-3C-1]MBJ7223779.1 hypothetical protein [Brenneria sp. L3-3C-1]MEE3645024.1 hypothetical protein [Brenneria sp. L3_3C_1]